MASADCLEADGIALIRGGRLLFEALSFRLEPGGALLVSGANGVGKSSLLRLVAGLLLYTFTLTPLRDRRRPW